MLLPRVSMTAFRNGDADATRCFVEAMRRHSFVVLAGDDAEANSILAQLVESTVVFFKRKDRANYKGVVGKTAAHGYPLWGTGYTHSFVGGKSRLGREQWHIVVGASDEETPWPPDQEDQETQEEEEEEEGGGRDDVNSATASIPKHIAGSDSRLLPSELAVEPRAVLQTDFTAGSGNALQACVASLFNLELESVPNFITLECGYEAGIQHFVAPHFTAKKVSLATPATLPAGKLVILRGKSPRGNHGHVVVARVVGHDGLSFVDVHDPYPPVSAGAGAGAGASVGAGAGAGAASFLDLSEPFGWCMLFEPIAAAAPQPPSSMRSACAAGVKLLEGVTVKGLAALLSDGVGVGDGEGVRAALADTRAAHGDSSVLDLFHYTAADGDYGMGDHTDPGLLTILPASCTPALEVFDVESKSWVAVERMCGTKSLDAESRDAIIFGGHMLEELTHGGVRAARHLVAKTPNPRYSTIYELRADSALLPLVSSSGGAAMVAAAAAVAAQQLEGDGGDEAEDAAAAAAAAAVPHSDGSSDGCGVVAEKDREMTESEVQAQLRRLGIVP